MSLLHPNPVEFWYDKQVFAKGLVDLCKMFRFDGILVSLHGHSSQWDKNLLSREEIKEGEYLLNFTDRTELHTLNDLPLVTYLQPKRYPSIEELDVERDIPSVIDYIPVSQNLYFRLEQEALFDIFDILHAQVGDTYSIHGEITSPFDYFLDLLGYENGLIALIMEPEKCKQMLEKFARGIRDLAVRMCDMQIDAIKISSPFAGMGFISADQYAEFVLPYERMIIREIRDREVHAYLHTCGSINDRLELMRESSASGLECLDPAPVGNVNLADAFSRIGNDLFIKGNIDAVNTLLLGSQEKVEKEVRQILDLGMNQGKGFILSTACSIAPKVTGERLLMLSQLIDQFGTYPQD